MEFLERGISKMKSFGNERAPEATPTDGIIFTTQFCSTQSRKILHGSRNTRPTTRRTRPSFIITLSQEPDGVTPRTISPPQGPAKAVLESPGMESMSNERAFIGNTPSRDWRNWTRRVESSGRKSRE